MVMPAIGGNCGKRGGGKFRSIVSSNKRPSETLRNIYTVPVERDIGGKERKSDGDNRRLTIGSERSMVPKVRKFSAKRMTKLKTRYWRTRTPIIAANEKREEKISALRAQR